jgi:hypothetical protein
MTKFVQVLERAKQLCEEDGFEWDVEFKLPLPKYAPRRLRPILDEEGRCKYLARAREELHKESGGVA